MTRQELEAWLCGDDASPPTAAEVAALIGVPLGVPLGAGRAGLRFTLALLRDVFPEDAVVRRWLRTPRAELGGRSGIDLLRAGATDPVEELALREWHHPGTLPAVVAAGA